MSHDAKNLERLFETCFRDEFETVLVGGADEPLYLPSLSPADLPHRILYREDYFASALHEVAHWCVAGAKRRTLEDYGYWYAPDGRDTDQQAEFERVEVRPQALEWIFSDACSFEFQLSADNLDSGVGPSERFAQAVERQKRQYLVSGLSPRAESFRSALEQSTGQTRRPSPRAVSPRA